MAVSQLQRASGRPHPVEHLRKATLNDIQFLVDLAGDVYGQEKYHYYGKYDPMKFRLFFERCLNERSVLILRGEHSAGVACALNLFYLERPRGHILHFFSRPKGLSREAFRVLQGLIAWLRDQGCFQASFGSEIGTDFGPFAKLLGASPANPSYVVRFDEETENA